MQMSCSMQYTVESLLLIRGGQGSWIVKILPVRGDVISRVSGFRHYNAKQTHYFVKRLRRREFLGKGDPHEIHEHQSPTNNDEFHST